MVVEWAGVFLAIVTDFCMANVVWKQEKATIFDGYQTKVINQDSAMENINETKQEWVAPEIINLDIQNTASGPVELESEMTEVAGPIS